jgi:allophanate hydrolase subunit 1
LKLSPAGDRGLLLTLGDVDAATLHATAAQVRSRADVRACVVGHSSLLVLFHGEPGPLEIGDVAPLRDAGTTHVIDVGFDNAPDLTEFLSHIDVSRAEFLAQVADLQLTARYIGFRGGFAYLDGWPAEWSMPRRATSRLVAAGSFAIAGAMAGFYPIDSPGGWNILGRTGRDMKFAIAAGDEIRIRPSGAPPTPAAPLRDRNAAEVGGAPLIPFINVVASPLTHVVSAEDWSGVDRGVSPGGPFDLEAAAAANRAVGNDETAPLLECALVGPRVTVQRDVVASWFGATAEIAVDGNAVDARQFEVRSGATITTGRLRDGLRGYLAIGSSRGEVATLERRDRLRIETIAGPHQSPRRELHCEVTRQLDRVGIRMRPLHDTGVRAPADLPSCGMQCGTLQLHPDGSVIAMGPDHPVTGGYLQPMTVVSGERWKLAQLTPGDRVSFIARHSP